MLVAERPAEPLRLVEMVPHAGQIAERDERVPEVDVNVDGQFGRLPAFWEAAEGPERQLQLGQGLAIGCPEPWPGAPPGGDTTSASFAAVSPASPPQVRQQRRPELESRSLLAPRPQ